MTPREARLLLGCARIILRQLAYRCNDLGHGDVARRLHGAADVLLDAPSPPPPPPPDSAWEDSE